MTGFEPDAKFELYNMTWTIFRTINVQKDVYEYIVYVHNFELHHLRERFDWEVTTEEVREHADNEAFSEYEKQKLIDCVMSDIVEYAALCGWLSSKPMYMFEPVIPEGRAREYWELKNG